MTIWDEMQTDMAEVANFMSNPMSVLAGLEVVMTLAPLTCAAGLQATRTTMLKIAALAAVGVELADAEIRTAIDEENDE